MRSLVRAGRLSRFHVGTEHRAVVIDYTKAVNYPADVAFEELLLGSNLAGDGFDALEEVGE